MSQRPYGYVIPGDGHQYDLMAEYAVLCELAKRHGMTVGIVVSREKYSLRGHRHSSDHRVVTGLQLYAGRRLASEVKCHGFEDLSGASARLARQAGLA